MGVSELEGLQGEYERGKPFSEEKPSATFGVLCHSQSPVRMGEGRNHRTGEAEGLPQPGLQNRCGDGEFTLLSTNAS